MSKGEYRKDQASGGGGGGGRGAYNIKAAVSTGRARARDGENVLSRAASLSACRPATRMGRDGSRWRRCIHGNTEGRMYARQVDDEEAPGNHQSACVSQTGWSVPERARGAWRANLACRCKCRCVCCVKVGETGEEGRIRRTRRTRRIGRQRDGLQGRMSMNSSPSTACLQHVAGWIA